MFSRHLLLAAVCALIAIEPAGAITIRNMTTGTLLFSDDFEGVGTNVSHADYPDASGDFDPVAHVGSWQITGGGLSEAINMEAFESDIQVTDFEGLAGRFQGNNYLRVDRAESNSSALAILSSPQTRAANEGHLIRLETMFAVDPGNDTSVGFSLVDSNAPEGSTNSITLPLFTPSGAVNNRLNFPTEQQGLDFAGVDPSQEHSNGTRWDRLVLDYVIGSSTYQLSVNGVQATFEGSPDLQIAHRDGNGNVLVPDDIVGVRFTGGSRAASGGTRVSQILLDAVRPTPELIIDRTTGNVSLVNNSGEPVTIIAYQLTSDHGALNPAAWTSIASNYDLGEDGEVDGDDDWVELTAASSRTDLSELETGPEFNGATLAPTQSVNLGNAWIKSRVEDVRAVVLTADGSELDANVTFVPGSAGLAPFAFGDLDFDGDFDVADFRNVFLGNMLTNTTGLSPAEAYQAGDFNTDGIADELDFLLYNQAYLTANPGATALSLAATTVPEPSSLLLAGLGILALAGCRRGRGRLFVAGRHVRTCALAATTLLVGASGAEAANLVGWWNLADGMGTTATDSSPMPAGGSPNHGTLMNIDVTTGGNGNWNDDLSGATDGITMPHGLKFDGMANQAAGATPLGDFVSLDAHTQDFLPLSQGTISAWFRLDTSATTGAYTILGAGRPADSSYMRILVQQTASVKTLYVNQNFTVPAEGTSKQHAIPFVNEGNWHHVAFSSDGSVSNVYIDGLNVATGDLGFLPVSVEQLAIGYTERADAPLWYFDGTIGDVRIYDGVLDQGEINYLSNPQNYGNGLVETAFPLNIRVNEVTGEVLLHNNSGLPVEFDFYRIQSETPNALLPGDGNWESLEDAGHDASGDLAWAELVASSTRLSEGFLGSSTTLADGQSLSLGQAYNTAVGTTDLTFEFHLAGTPAEQVLTATPTYFTPIRLEGDFNADGKVDAADYVVWRNNLNADESVLNGNGNNSGVVDIGDYSLWKSRYGNTAGGAATLAAAQVPEPASYALLLVACGAIGFVRKRTSNVRRAGLMLLLGFAALAASSPARAVVSVSRYYTMGDYSEGADYEGKGPENGSEGDVVSSSFGVQHDVLDSTGPDYVDLDKGTTNPKYASVTSGTYARPNPGAGNDYAILFDGDDDYLFTATTLNNPGINMGSEGMQMWVYPRADNLGVTGQAIVFDTGNVGGPAITESGHWTQISFGHIDLPATVPVVANQWAHVAQHVYRHADADAPDIVSGSGTARTFTSVMYVNGVAVSANNDNDLGAETSGGFLIGAADAALPGAAVAPTAFFSGVIDELEVYTSAANEFDLFLDNDWIAARIAQIPGGTLKMGDINFDGQVGPADVDSFVAGWRKEKRFDGPHNDLWVADWETRGWGDLNLDGRVDLRDALLLHSALQGAGAGGLDFALLGAGGTTVPEPSTVVLLSGFTLAAAIAWRRRRT